MQNTKTLQICIWRSSTTQPDQKTLIGDITISECDQPLVDWLVVKVNQPKDFGPRPFLMARGALAGPLIEVVADLATKLDPTLNGLLRIPAERNSCERWGVLLKVSITGPHPREVAKLIVTAVESDPTEFSASWVEFETVAPIRRAQVEFLLPPNCPWRVLRAATTVMARVGALYGVVGARFGDLVDDNAAKAPASEDGR
jgi:hypothetical protein